MSDPFVKYPDRAAEDEVEARRLVDAERQRQRQRWGTDHDWLHGPRPLLAAARCYEAESMEGWPWDLYAWKPTDPMRNLVKAAALFQAAADCSPPRLPMAPVIREALEGRARCEVVIARMLAALEQPVPRGEAEVKAEALREAAASLRLGLDTSNGVGMGVEYACDLLDARADRLVRDALGGERGEGA